MTKRRKEYVKARNIVRNNLEKQHFAVNVTAKTAKYIVMAYNLYQRQALKRRESTMSFIKAHNEALHVQRVLSATTMDEFQKA